MRLDVNISKAWSKGALLTCKKKFVLFSRYYYKYAKEFWKT